MLHFHAIESAILLGCDAYAFGHGDEPYKLSYGAEPLRLASLAVARPGGGWPGVFDSIGSGAAMRQIDGFFAAGKVERARRACRQIAALFE
jgi:CelD/BcsL family acetyltransferase involved in cellulose biosynthesis